MYKKLLFVMVCLSLFSVIIAACSIKEQVEASTKVKMGSADFIDKEVTVKKGESIALVDTVSAPHTIANGSWAGNKAKVATEPGAPVVSNVNFTGNDSKNIGPFTTAGTFKFYCTIHPGMNLTVTVV
ncbi:cupredoxin domain-containing protein [Ktedonospora formicarum]|uniref:Blue (type 1) copper domain-containing protein n=1 Tax=Ktedonospora formicarum TaxID=2778364 RepID=A0A8J3I6L1_9CHLR|nr:plastocyanin/azurin family copper-binding protein [Ktedonospora formicarum]GHO45654.1 hypothetical protein KSX_38170 [Ktedonospora formicarum]